MFLTGPSEVICGQGWKSMPALVYDSLVNKYQLLTQFFESGRTNVNDTQEISTEPKQGQLLPHFQK